jgi:hypothetical protein
VTRKAHTVAGFGGINLARGVVVGVPGLTGIAAITRSAIAVIVRLGFTPGLAGNPGQAPTGELSLEGGHERCAR